jgi:hypothetical protein
LLALMCMPSIIAYLHTCVLPTIHGLASTP